VRTSSPKPLCRSMWNTRKPTALSGRSGVVNLSAWRERPDQLSSRTCQHYPQRQADLFNTDPRSAVPSSIDIGRAARFVNSYLKSAAALLESSPLGKPQARGESFDNASALEGTPSAPRISEGRSAKCRGQQCPHRHVSTEPSSLIARSRDRRQLSHRPTMTTPSNATLPLRRTDRRA
jgi:hypothetical protein